MSDIIGIGIKNATSRVCHVAYTLNNEQPVVSTIIGDQPLFYMDFEADFEEEELFDAADLNILENEILNLKADINTLDKFSESFSGSSETPLEGFTKNKVHFESTQTPENTDISALIDTLSKSRLAEGYLAFTTEHKIKIKLCNQVSDALYDRQAGMIFVNANMDEADQILMLARELRRHWQHRQGALIQPLMFHPDSAVLVNRVQCADLAVSMIRIAWELQLSEYKCAWERLENSSMSDLARAFAREAFLDFRTINNGQAMASVFEAWFLSERCRVEDRSLIQGMLADYQGYVFDLEEAEKSITPALIAALGTTPFGKNYLSEHVSTLMNDAIFTDVRDRSNANFLWFIKFERSFQETEQELQHSTDHTADGIRQAALLKENQDRNNATGKKSEQHGEVISLPTAAKPKGKRRLSEKSTECDKDAKSAEIIYLR